MGICFGILLAGPVSLIFLSTYFHRQTLNEEKLIAQQAEQIESLNKSSLAPLLQNILENIDYELRNDPRRALSNELIDRIVSSCYFFKPYFHPAGDSTSKEALSPERGQLLLLLSKMNIDSVSYHKLLMQASFEGADLREANLRGIDLRDVDLHHADLQGAHLAAAILNGANLSFANLWGADLNHSHLQEAHLQRANLAWSNLNGANLTGADLHEADLTSAQMRNANAQGAILQWVDFKGTFLNEADVSRADLFRANFTRAQLVKTNLSDSNLNYAIVSDANITQADLTDADLTNLVTSEEHWLELLNTWLVTGAQEIQEKYKEVEGISFEHSKYKLIKIND